GSVTINVTPEGNGGHDITQCQKMPDNSCQKLVQDACGETYYSPCDPSLCAPPACPYNSTTVFFKDITAGSNWTTIYNLYTNHSYEIGAFHNTTQPAQSQLPASDVPTINVTMIFQGGSYASYTFANGGTFTIPSNAVDIYSYAMTNGNWQGNEANKC